MMTTDTEHAEKIKKFILMDILDGQSDSVLQDDTPLVTGGILDSMGILKLVGFLEETFKVEIAPHEADVEHLNTVSDIVGLVQSKGG